MRSTVKLCDNCGSAITSVKHGNKVSVECSYCGKSYDKDSTTPVFDESNFDGEDDGEV